MGKLKAVILGVVVVLVISVSTTGWAAPVTFDYSGTNVAFQFSGSFTMDDALFNNTASQFILHSTITAFDFTVASLSGPPFIQVTWELSNLIPTSGFFFDSSGAIPDVVDASFESALVPLGLAFSGTGGASADGFGSAEGDWTVAPVPSPSTMLLMGTGLLGLIGYRKWSNKTN